MKMIIRKKQIEYIHLTPKEGKYDEVKKMLGLNETDHNEDGSGNGHLKYQKLSFVREYYSDKLKELCDEIEYYDNEGVLDLEEEI